MRREARAAMIAVVSVLGFGLLIVAAGLPLYVHPPEEEIPESALVYVIGPPSDARLDRASRLRQDGVAERLLVSVPAKGASSASRLAVCRDAATVCGTPDPFTTNGETLLLAQHLRDQPLQGAAGHTVVLTFTPHVARTRYIFDKCYDGEVTVIAVDAGLSPGDWAYQYLYQSAAFVKAWVTPCATED